MSTEAGQVLAMAAETKRALRQWVSEALGTATGKDAAEKTARAAMTVLGGLDAVTVRRGCLAFLVKLAADDARFRSGANIGPTPRKPKSDAPPGGKQSLTKPMPRSTIYAGENFPASAKEARYAEAIARQRAQQKVDGDA